MEFIRFTVDCLDWSDGNVFCLSNKASNRSWQNSEDGAVWETFIAGILDRNLSNNLWSNTHREKIYLVKEIKLSNFKIYIYTIIYINTDKNIFKQFFKFPKFNF